MKVLTIILAVLLKSITAYSQTAPLDTLYLTKEYKMLSNDSLKTAQLRIEAEKFFFNNPSYSVALLEHSLPLLEKLPYTTLKLENYKAYAYGLSQINNIYESKIAFSKALKLANELHDTINLAFINNMVAYNYFSINQYDSSLFYYHKAINLLDKMAFKNKPLWLRTYSVVYTNLGNLYNFNIKEYGEAVKSYRKVYQIAVKQKDTTHIAASMANIGITYFDKGDYDSANIYLSNAYILAEKIGHVFYLGTIALNLSQCASNSGKNDRAIEYGLKSTSYFQQTGNSRNIIKSTSNLIEVYLNAGEIKKSHEVLIRLIKDSTLVNQLMLSKVYKIASNYYKAVNQLDSALFYLSKYYLMEKELKEKQNLEIINRLLVEYKTREAKLKNQMLTESLALSKKKQIYVLIISLILIVALIFGFVNLKLKRKILLNRLEIKNKELTTTSLHLLRQSEFLSSISSDIRKLLPRADDKGKSIIRGLVSRIAIHSNKEMWLGFERSFSEVYTSFFKNLEEKHPNLTTKDKKIAAFLKLRMSTKDIATVNSMTVRGVESARHRLRKKLNIASDMDLITYLDAF